LVPEGEDLYAGVMVIDLVTAQFRLVVSGNFEHSVPVTTLE